MNPSPTSILICVAATLVLGAAQAGALDEFDLDPDFRAKLAKQKAKLNTQKASTFNFSAGPNQDDAQCGSQNIGNIDTGGKIGVVPREVFVFAPNAINLVSGRGCKQ